MGVDVGNARVGTALSDPDGILATPLKTLRRDHKRILIVAYCVNSRRLMM